MKTRFLSLSLLFVSLFAFANKNTVDPNAIQMQKIRVFFRDLNKETLHKVDQFYDANVEFQDPVRTLKGPEAIKEFYGKFYNEIKSVRFQELRTVSQAPTHMIAWKMFLQSDGLNSGKEYSVDGTSIFIFAGDKVIYHRDYFDMGQLIYERIPFVGPITRYVKKKFSF